MKSFHARHLFVLVSVFPQLLLAFMRGDLSEFAFSSAGHFQLLLDKPENQYWFTPAG